MSDEPGGRVPRAETREREAAGLQADVAVLAEENTVLRDELRREQQSSGGGVAGGRA